MANNLSEVFNTLNAMNTTFEFNSTEIIANAINYSNVQSDNWIGIFIFILLGLSLFIFINKNKNNFKLNNDLQMSLFMLNVLIDVGFIIYQFRILANVQLVIFIYTAFVGLCVFSVIQKDKEEVN